jgi:glycosyltransferase involved in cell wall biosynthesis
MKITVVTPLFAIAGVPLAQLRFARILASRGHEVELVFGRIDQEFRLPEVTGFSVINFACKNVRSMFLPLRQYLKVAQPEIIFSAEDHLNAIVIMAAIASGSKASISGSSRVTPFDTYSNKPFTKRWILKQVMRTLMWRADVLTCVSRDMVAQYHQVFSKSKHTCVYNIVADPQFQNRAAEPVNHPWLGDSDTYIPTLVAAGRLAPWKGFGDLIDAIALVKVKRPIRLLILGDGPLRSELQARIDAHGLFDCVQLVGYVENPLKYFSRADVFVLSSHVEGLPNVLVEAMLCGCTPVATDCPTGPREVLDDGRYGYLVKPRDPSSIADGLLKALDAPIPADLLAQAICPFQEEAVISRHFELLGLPERAGGMAVPN